MAVIPVQTIGWTGGDAVVPTPTGFMVIGIFELAEVIDKGHVTVVDGRDQPVFIGRLPGCPEERIYPIIPGRVPMVLGDRPITAVLAQDRATVVADMTPAEVAAREAIEVAARELTEAAKRRAADLADRDEVDSGGFERSKRSDSDCS